MTWKGRVCQLVYTEMGIETHLVVLLDGLHSGSDSVSEEVVGSKGVDIHVAIRPLSVYAI
jgi:hypothetical protein